MNAVSKITSLLFVFSGAIFAQHIDTIGFGFGVKGGLGAVDLLDSANFINGNSAYTIRSSNYIVGPVGEVMFPFGLAFELDGLYRSANYQLISNSFITNINASAWEIPYLGKFRFPFPVVKPFLSAGGAYRTFTGLPNNIVTPSHNAFVLGGGVELHVYKVRASAEARWYRWGSANVNPVALVQNQAEVLFGIVF
jgi:hypothetical protein